MQRILGFDIILGPVCTACYYYEIEVAPYQICLVGTMPQSRTGPYEEQGKVHRYISSPLAAKLVTCVLSHFLNRLAH